MTHSKKMGRLEYLSIMFLCLTAVVLIALQMKQAGWIVYGVGIGASLLCAKQFRRHILLVYLSLGLLGITPITTDISYGHMLGMGTTLGLAVALPYLVSRYMYTDDAVRFRFHHGRRWYKSELLYIGFTAIVSYFLLPFYLRNTRAYLNWVVDPGASNIIRLFIGTNALGIWDELFFVSTVLGILRRYLPFVWANLVQSVLFTSFLFELGFTGWGFALVFFFALIQGVVFRKTDSLLYVITIHLTLDLILFLALIHAHHPDWLPIFLT